VPVAADDVNAECRNDRDLALLAIVTERDCDS